MPHFDLNKVLFAPDDAAPATEVSNTISPLPDAIPVPVADTPPTPTVVVEAPSGETTQNNATSAVDDNEPTVIESLGALLGYEVEGDFADDYDGIAAYTRAVGETIATERQAEMDEALPDVAEYREFRRNGGRPQDFFAASSPETDYSDLAVPEANVMLQRQLLTTLLTAQGYNADEITETITDAETAGTLLKQSLRAKSMLAKSQETAKADLIINQQEAARQQAEDNVNYWTGVKTTVTKGKLGSVVVPEADRNKFFEWMSKPIDRNGNSQRTLDRAKLGPERELLSEYLLFKDFDIGKLAATIKTTQATVDLKKKLNPVPTAASRTQGGSPASVRAPRLQSFEDMLSD